MWPNFENLRLNWTRHTYVLNVQELFTIEGRIGWLKNVRYSLEAMTQTTLQWPRIRYNYQAYVTMTQHASQWHSIRYNDPAYVIMTQHTLQWPSIRYNNPAYVTMTQHTLQWHSIRYNDPAYVTITKHSLQWPSIHYNDTAHVIEFHFSGFGVNKKAEFILSFLYSQI